MTKDGYEAMARCDSDSREGAAAPILGARDGRVEGKRVEAHELFRRSYLMHRASQAYLEKEVQKLFTSERRVWNEAQRGGQSR